MPAILVGLAVLFIAMIVFEWGMDITGRQSRQYTSNVVGKVNGEEISYPQFQKILDNAVDEYKTNSKQDPDDQMMAQLRDQVWQELVNQILIRQAAERLGIMVTDQEIVNWVTNNPESLPDPIKKNFEDSTGQINRQILQEALAIERAQSSAVLAERSGIFEGAASSGKVDKPPFQRSKNSGEHNQNAVRTAK